MRHDNTAIKEIKALGGKRDNESLRALLKLWETATDINIRREIASSIGRHPDNARVYSFILDNAFSDLPMDIVCQLYRTCLYREKKLPMFRDLGESIRSFYNNEMLEMMRRYHDAKGQKLLPQIRAVCAPVLLCGPNVEKLGFLPEGGIQMAFTSPPYYNAREYSNYRSYKEYLALMIESARAVCRVLEPGRHFIVNISPVIARRAGREFASIRYPLHFDFHRVLTDAGLTFIDEIKWIKPEGAAKDRNGGYRNSRMPLSWRPNSVTESLLVYRKDAGFLVDENIAMYDRSLANGDDDFEKTDCWLIKPKASGRHPAVFPEELCERVLKFWSYPNDCVLDPFAGSGTFGRAAMKLGRIPVLCEINPEYQALINEKNEYELK